MDSNSEVPECRDVVLHPDVSDVGALPGERDDRTVVVLDLVSMSILEGQASVIDAVRQYYRQAVSRWSSLEASKNSSFPVHSPPFRRSSLASTRRLWDPERGTVVFPIVTGPIGSGTSQLIEYALKDLVGQEQHGYYIHAKFDRRQHADPYRPLVVAWTAFCHDVVRRGPAAIAAMRDDIRSACESETSALLAVIPALSAILEYRENDDTTALYDGTAALQDRELVRGMPVRNDDSTSQRFLFVFQTFLKAISNTSHPIVLVLDHLQWADPSSIDFLCSILQDVQEMPGLFVIGTHDKALDVTSVVVDNTDQEQVLVRKLQDLVERSNNAVAVETIPVHNLDSDQVKQVMNQALQQSALFDVQIEEDICRLVYQQTDGNAALMATFLQWLHHVGLLKKVRPHNSSTSFTYWTWDINAIHREIVDRVKDSRMGDLVIPFYVTDLFTDLAPKMIELLKVCACLGCLHTDEIILEYVLEYPIGSILSEAESSGILDVGGNDASKSARQSYCFKYDILEMAAYDLIPERDRELFHLEIGRRLWRRLSQEVLDQYIFVVLSQLILGRRLISRPKERYSIASLCLHAGRKAAKLSSFRSASIYLNFGTELLGDQGWKDVYDLSLALHNDACEIEICESNFEGMEVLVDAITQHARSDKDTLQARTTQLYAFSVSDRQLEGLDLGLQLLRDVGSPLPKRLSTRTFIRQLRSVQRMLKGKSNEYLKRLPLIEDEDVLVAMRILHLIFLPAILQRAKLVPYISLMMTSLTLKHGLCFMSPLALAAYGVLCIGISDTDSAFRFGDLGMELLDQLQVREYVPRVYTMYYSFIYVWKYPIKYALGPLLHAHRVGMNTGDIEYSCLCANLWCFMSVDSGLPLDEIEKQWKVLYRTMISHRQTSLIQMSAPWLQYIAHYRGQNVDFIETEAILRDQSTGERDLHAIYWWQAKTAYLFNDLVRADELAYMANFSKVKASASPAMENVFIAFMNGMIAFAMVMDQQRGASVPSPRRSRMQYLREGRNMIGYVGKYALWCPANFLDRKFLLQAELTAVKKQSDKAMELYACAIAFAKDSGNIFIQALANERACRYCLHTLRKVPRALSFFHEALSAYTEWGALRKVDHLNAELKDLFQSVEH